MPNVPAHPVCDVIACEICMKEIPRDLAKTEEAAEVVYHFCGMDCYAKWQQLGDDRRTREKGKT